MIKPSDSQDLVLRITQASRNLSSLFDARLRTLGLTAARGRVLLFLSRQDAPVGQGQITAFMRVENPTAVRILDGLEALGYIRRLPDPSDRRAKLVELTLAGRPRAERVLQVTQQLNGSILEGIEPDDLDGAKRVLAKILDNIVKSSLELESTDDEVAA